MKDLIASKESFIELQKLVESFCNDSEPSNDVVVLLSPDDFAVKEVQYTSETTTFIGYPDSSGKYQAIPVSNGSKFKVCILFPNPTSGSARRVTMFLDQSPRR